MGIIHDTKLGPVEITEAEASALRGSLRPLIGPDQVKAECRRRILLIMTEDQQRNTLAAGQAAMMDYGADPSTWPSELQRRQAAAVAAWAEIERLRARSNEIEALDPLPADIRDDGLWG